MSFIGFRGLPIRRVYAKQYERDKDPFGNISIVHPLHPMRQAETIVVSSLREMENIIAVSVDIVNLTGDNGSFYYATEEDVIPKPEIEIRIEDGPSGILRLATTINIPIDTHNVDGISDAIKGILTRRLDALEAQLWAQLFYFSGFILDIPTFPQTFRELFALAKTFISRIVPTNSFNVILSPRAFGAAVFENMLSPSIVASHTEHQIASGSLNLIPIAGEVFPSVEPVSVYPSHFPSVCRRYIYERYYDEVVVDEAEDRNYRRITAERYFAPLVPRDYYYNLGGYSAAPIVTLAGRDATNNIQNYYSPDVLNNLNYITNVT